MLSGKKDEYVTTLNWKFHKAAYCLLEQLLVPDRQYLPMLSISGTYTHSHTAWALWMPQALPSALRAEGGRAQA